MTVQDPQEPNKNSASEEEESSDHPVKSGWYDDPEGSGGLRWYDAKANKWSETVSEAAHVNLESEASSDSSGDHKENNEDKDSLVDDQVFDGRDISSYPVLQKWKTSVGYAALGLVSNFLFFILLTLAFACGYELYIGDGPASYSAAGLGNLAGAPAGLITYVLLAIYAGFVYPSFFKEKPLIKSSKLISFTNLFFGGLIFGLIWNSNLTKSRLTQKEIKGSSWKYAVVLSCIAILVVGWMVLKIDLPNLEKVKNYNTSHTASSSVSSTEQLTSAPEEFSDKASGVSFTIPQNWKRGSIHSSEATYLKCRLLPRGKSDEAQIGFMSWDMYDELSSKEKQIIARKDYNISLYDKADVMEDVKQYFSKIDESSAEKVNINGRQYWRVQTDGTSAKGTLWDGSTVPIRIIEYFSVDNGYAYCFFFMCKTTTGDTEDLTKTMSQFMNSVKYGS